MDLPSQHLRSRLFHSGSVTLRFQTVGRFTHWLNTVALPCSALGDKLLSFCAVFAFPLKEYLRPWLDSTVITAESGVLANTLQQPWTLSQEPYCIRHISTHWYFNSVSNNDAIITVFWVKFSIRECLPAYLSQTPFNLAEAFVQGQIVTNWVLPASGSVGEVREVLENPAVDFFNRQRFVGRLLYGHVDEERKWKRRFRLQRVPLSAFAVWRVRGRGGWWWALVGSVVSLNVK